MTKPPSPKTDLATVFSQVEIQLMLEALYGLEQMKKDAVEFVGAQLLAVGTIQISPEDFGVDVVQRLIAWFAAASHAGPKLVS